MVPLMFSTIISCSQAVGLINRVYSMVNLTAVQKAEIIAELRSLVPTCPVTIKKDEPRKK